MSETEGHVGDPTPAMIDQFKRVMIYLRYWTDEPHEHLAYPVLCWICGALGYGPDHSAVTVAVEAEPDETEEDIIYQRVLAIVDAWAESVSDQNVQVDQQTIQMTEQLRDLAEGAGP